MVTFKRFILVGITVTTLLCQSYFAMAQDETPAVTPETKVRVTLEDKNTETPDYSNAYYVLGRELTKREKEANGDNLTKEQIKNTVLPNEQKLVIVRALVAVEAGNDIKRILDVYYPPDLQTFEDLIDYFTHLREKFGSVRTGIESEFVYNIRDDQEAFKKAASIAYQHVFGIPEDKQDKDKIFGFLIQKNALTYSKMVNAFLEEMTPEMKKQILFTALDEVGREDLKANKKFVAKLLEQQITYEYLIKLLSDVNQGTKVQTKK